MLVSIPNFETPKIHAPVSAGDRPIFHVQVLLLASTECCMFSIKRSYDSVVPDGVKTLVFTNAPISKPRALAQMLVFDCGLNIKVLTDVCGMSFSTTFCFAILKTSES